MGALAESEQAERDRQAIALLAKAARKSESPSDQLAYRMDMLLVAHPEWCSTDADYPGWTPAMGCCQAHTQGGAR
jgi:hypothetical protein